MTDPFADPTEGFPRLRTLDGCSVVIIPLSVEAKAARDPKPGKTTYDLFHCDVIVVDGKPNELVSTFPKTLRDFGISDSWVVSDLRRNLEERRPLLAKVVTKPGTRNSQIREARVEPIESKETRLKAAELYGVWEQEQAAKLADPENPFK